jgi:SagB-type dehydrogenase family enzyme
MVSIMSQETDTAAGYHRTTSYRRHLLTPHALDWAHQPVPTKRYPQANRVSLDRSRTLPEIDYSRIAGRAPTVDPGPPAPLDVRKLSTLFHLTQDVTARAMHGGQPFYYRSVASAGALYPFELYLAANRIDGLAPGVYHYNLLDFSLTALRRGPVPGIPPAARNLTATFYITGIFFRSAWKYRSRAYRYVLLDAGHLLENLRLALAAMGMAHSIHLDFDDRRAATLLGLDPQREVCLACVHLYGDPTGEKENPVANALKPLAGAILKASMVSDREIAYPDILRIHQAGNTTENRFVDALPAPTVLKATPTVWTDLISPDPPVSADYVRVLWQRRSRRNFVPATVSRDDWMTFMDLLTRHMTAASAMPPACRSALTVGFLAGAGMPVPAGFYLLDPDGRRWGRMSGGDLIEPMAAACLDQMWLKHAGVHMTFMTDLAALDRTWGARGYRYAMIEAGRLGQQAYLAATALGWGACGIGAIYDREAADLLNLAGDGALLYLVGVGPVKRQ